MNPAQSSSQNSTQNSTQTSAVNPIDTSRSLRIAILMEMLEDVSKALGAEEAVQAYARRIRRVRPLDAFYALSVEALPRGQFRITRTLRAESVGGRGVLTPEPSDAELASLPIHSSGFFAQIVARPDPQLYQQLKLASDPVLGPALAEMGSCVAVPQFQRGRITDWSILFRREPTGYSFEDLEDDLLIINLLGSMVQNLESVQRIGSLHQQLHDQFAEVARVQRALLPASLPDHPGLTFAASYLTSGQAGGDYYDFLPRPDGSILVFIADVSGHGPAAATVMAMLHAILHACPCLDNGPAAILRFANSHLARSSIDGSHVTAVMAQVHPAASHITIARAGHPLPRLRSLSGAVRPLEGPAAPPMGIIADGFDSTDYTLPLAPGDTVVLFTDGLPEGENARGEQFGIPRLDAAISSSSGAPDAVVQAIHNDIAAFTGRASRDDDQTLVVIHVQPHT